jgi:hypothetical protein
MDSGRWLVEPAFTNPHYREFESGVFNRYFYAADFIEPTTPWYVATFMGDSFTPFNQV